MQGIFLLVMGSGKLNAADRCRFSSRELDSEGNDRDSLEECCGVPDCCRDAGDAQALTLRSLARPPRLELGTPGLEGRCSIQLSYGRIWWGTVSVASLCRLRLVRCCREALGLSGATLATDVIETLHRLVQSHPPYVQVCVRLADVGVSEHFLYVMYWPATFQPSRSGLMPEIVEAQIDPTQGRAGCWTQLPVLRPSRLVPMRAQHAGLSCLLGALNPLAEDAKHVFGLSNTSCLLGRPGPFPARPPNGSRWAVAVKPRNARATSPNLAWLRSGGSGIVPPNVGSGYRSAAPGR